MAPTPALLPFLFLAFAAVCNARSDPATATKSVPDECAGRRIHIRRLPPRFNEQVLLNCSAYHPLYDDICPYLANGALGDKTHNGSRSWYRTDPIVLEPLFHRRLMEYPCLAPDPSAADAVFLPYYAALDALRYLYGPEVNSSHEHGLDLFDFLTRDHPGIWARRGGHDHFMVMAGRAWDFSQDPAAEPPVWGTSFLELPEFYNVTALVLESRAWPWQEQAIPYPTSFHPANLPLLESWIARARRSRRTVLMMFAGGGGSPNSAPNIRRSIRAECQNRTSFCEMVDCSNGVCEHDPIRVMRPMLRASFCLQPPGDTPTRRATFDGIIAGCIPVFFEEATAKSQYGWHLPPPEEYPSFSVHIPKEDVVGGGLSIANVLLGIPAVEVGRMRERVLEIAPRVIYRRHRSSAGLRSQKDAVDVAVEGALRRIRGRLRSLQAVHPQRIIEAHAAVGGHEQQLLRRSSSHSEEVPSQQAFVLGQLRLFLLQRRVQCRRGRHLQRILAAAVECEGLTTAHAGSHSRIEQCTLKSFVFIRGVLFFSLSFFKTFIVVSLFL